MVKYQEMERVEKEEESLKENVDESQESSKANDPDEMDVIPVQVRRSKRYSLPIHFPGSRAVVPIGERRSNGYPSEK